ncbi:MAG: PspA/IM30 family protein [Solirubrobacterales bacterium]|jgi:phage shock protein A|nr:PspA/IM30 family protein [Solirubrobacterales bacterium]
MASASQRFSSLISARVAELLDRVEDPSDVLDHSCKQQLESLRQVRSAIAGTVSAKKRLRTREGELERAVVTLDTRARQAASTGDDQLARAALERRNVTQTELRSLDAQIVALGEQHRALVVAERKLRAKIEAFRDEKQAINAMHSAADARARILGAATSVGEELADAGIVLRRARQKLAEMSARADVLSELEGAGAFEDLTTFDSSSDDIDRRLAALSSSIAVDDALAALKAERTSR